MTANGPREALANLRKSGLVMYLLKWRMRLESIFSSFCKSKKPLVWCQGAHDNLDDLVGVIERWKPGLLLGEQQACYGIAQEPAQQSAGHHLEIHTGDELLLSCCLQQRHDEGEAALRDGREKQGTELREARCLGDDDPHQGQILRLSHQRQDLAGKLRQCLAQRWQIVGRGQGRKLLGKAWLRKRQMAQHIDKEFLFAGIVTIEGLLRGNTRLRQNGIDTGCQIALLKKQPLGCGAEPLARLLGACVLSVFHGYSSLFS